jgi:hypothetical protein
MIDESHTTPHLRIWIQSQDGAIMCRKRLLGNAWRYLSEVKPHYEETEQ